MNILLNSPKDIGTLVRAARQAENIRQDDAAGAMGVSDVFLWKLEKGSPGVRLDKLLQVLQALGVQLTADVSEATMSQYRTLLHKQRDPKLPAGRKKPRVTPA